MVVGRSGSPGEPTPSSFWVREGSGVQLLEDFDGGSEAKDLVTRAFS